MEERKSTTLDAIPAEVLSSIFTELDLCSLNSCLRVCKIWFEVGQDDALWKLLCKREFPFLLGSILAGDQTESSDAAQIKSPHYTVIKNHCLAIKEVGELKEHCRVLVFEQYFPCADEKEAKKRKAKEEQQIANWKKLMLKWPKNKNKCITASLAGIPDSFRGIAWSFFAGLQELKREYPSDIYNQLVARECPFDDMIAKDVPRTFPAHPFFPAHGPGQQSLSSVCRAISCMFPEVGYTSGMSQMLAIPLMYLSEVDAFWMGVYLFKGLGMADLLAPSFPKLQEVNSQLAGLLNALNAPLHNHMVNQSFTETLYSTPWFLTLFAYQTRFDVALRFWDLILVEGSYDVVVCCVASVVLSLEKKLLAADMVGMFEAMRQDPPCGPTLDVVIKLYKKARKMWKKKGGKF